MTMREEFEVFARRCFECSEYSFEKDNGVYFNHVGRQTFGGRRTSDFSSVQMLWETWQTCAAAATETERNKCKYPKCLENEDDRCSRWLTGECPGPENLFSSNPAFQGQPLSSQLVRVCQNT